MLIFSDAHVLEINHSIEILKKKRNSIEAYKCRI
jgi:hypothetical protein